MNGGQQPPITPLTFTQWQSQGEDTGSLWADPLFVNPAPDCVPLTEQLGELPAILSRDIDLEGLVFHSRVDFGSNANWKIWNKRAKHSIAGNTACRFTKSSRLLKETA